MSEESREDDFDVDVFESNESLGVDAEGRWVELPHAGMLTIEDADHLLRWRSAYVIAVVGERNGGKTTLVTELYERYLRGPFAGYSYAQSLTMMGFEMKSFQSRADSGAELPDTPRTSKQDGLKFFHLALSSERQPRVDLLISERAGETYRDVRDRPVQATSIIEVQKAVKVVFILDGERVADPLRRSEAIASVRLLARAFFDSGSISSAAELQLVTTKWDLLNVDALEKARAVLADFEKNFVEAYTGRGMKASTFRVAARDPKGCLEAGYGMAPLLQSWLEPAAQAKFCAPPLPNLVDEFDRLLIRRKFDEH